jgi:hypothetical protein
VRVSSKLLHKDPEFKEIKGSLFNLNDRHTIMHCISSDRSMSRGFALEICKRYPLNRNICYTKVGTISTCEYYNRKIINLVTKLKNIRVVVMPKIGCGRDRLDWEVVKLIIKKCFFNSNIKITIYI